jgi:hypothetical protein
VDTYLAWPRRASPKINAGVSQSVAMHVSRLKVSYRRREAGGMTVNLWVRTRS